MGATYTAQDRKLLASIGDRIRTIRLDRGYSQEELAFRADLDRTYVGSVERGERNISVINLQRIMHALGASAADALKSGKT